MSEHPRPFKVASKPMHFPSWAESTQSGRLFRPLADSQPLKFKPAVTVRRKEWMPVEILPRLMAGSKVDSSSSCRALRSLMRRSKTSQIWRRKCSLVKKRWKRKFSCLMRVRSRFHWPIKQPSLPKNWSLLNRIWIVQLILSKKHRE